MKTIKTIKLVKDAGGDGDVFYAVDGRFKVEAHRTESGYIRGWYVQDLSRFNPEMHPMDAQRRDADRFCENRNAVRAFIEERLSQELPAEKKKAIEAEVKMMLHAHRDCLRIKGVDTKKTSFDARDGYYGEAFGIMRALKVLGFGDFGAVNHPHTLSAWFNRLEREVLAEEHFEGDGKCEHCFKQYGHDDARPRPSRHPLDRDGE